MSITANRDIFIIGGGVIGLSIARKLHQQGHRQITILDRGNTGKESSWAAGGMIAVQAETNKADSFFKLCSESRDMFPQLAEELKCETGIDIELEQSGTLYLAFSEHDSREINDRYHWQKQAGLAVEKLTAEDVRKEEPFISPDVREGLFFPNDWQVENRKLLDALRAYAEINQIKIIEQTEVSSLTLQSGKVTGVSTGMQEFGAGQVVLATGAWTSLIKSAGHETAIPSVSPIKGQMLSFRTAKRMFFKVVYSPRGYIIPRLDGKILVGSTVEYAGFDKSVTDEGCRSILMNAAEISPSLEKVTVQESWAGLRPYVSDGLPVIGSVPDVEGLFVATGHYRNGILLAPITGKLVADLVSGETKANYNDAFGPARFKLKGVST